MASKVNVKFVVLLSAVLGMVFVGVALAFVYIKLKSGDHYVRLADARLAVGDINGADMYLARAVGKDQSKVDWLVKWRDVRRKKVPETQSTYQEDYGMYVSILRTLANAKRTDVDAHREYLEEIYTEGQTLVLNRDVWRGLATATDAALKFFDPDRPAALRRYRGLAIVSLGAIDAEVSDAETNAARDDLEAAVKANPTDNDAANGLALWHRTRGRKLLAAENRDGAAAEFAEGRKVIEALVAADPQSPFALVAQATLDAADAEAIPDPKKTAAELDKARMAAYDALKPRVKELAEKLKAAPPSKLSLDVLARFLQLAAAVDPKDGTMLALAVVDHAREPGHESADLMSLRSQLLAVTGDTEGSIAQDQAIIDLPKLPVSWAGMRQLDIRRRAMFQQTNAAMAMAFKATTDEARKAALARAAGYREQLAKNVPEHAPELLLIDGKLKYLEGDLRLSQRLLADFTKAPGDWGGQTAEAMLLSAEIAMKLDQVGTAIELLEKVRQTHQNSPGILLNLAQMYQRIQRSQVAEGLYKQVLELDPTNEAAKAGLRLAQGLRDATVKNDDPVVQVLVEAQRLQVGDGQKLGDEQAAVEFLEKNIATSGADARIVNAAARLRVARNELDLAKADVKAGLDKRPDDAEMKDYLKRLDAAGSLEGALALIEVQPGTPADKLWARSQVYRGFGKPEEAAAALAEMAKAAPTDVRAIEALFLAAIDRNDIAEAQRLTDVAVKVDADRADGDTYRARVLLAQGNFNEASALLERATTRGNAVPALYRLLGVVQLQLGRLEQGLASIRHALDMSPTDLTTIKMYLTALVQTNHRTEALALARESQAYAQRDTEFLNTWLALESATGNRAVALERREQLFKRNQASIDLVNGVALAELYIEGRAWDDARKLIDKLRVGNETDSRVVSVDARWHADKGDLDGARQVFITLIEDWGKKLPEGKPLPPDPYIVFGQFMMGRGRTDWGLAALRQAERLQDPAKMDVSLLLGDVLLGQSLFPEAEAVYAKVVAAGVADPRHEIRKRLIEAKVQQRKLAEAEAEFVKLGAAADDDVEMMAQRAHTARGLGDMKRAKEILDRAVAKFPSEPLAYVRRARLLMVDTATVKDALADLDTAIKLRPTMWQARHTRGMLLLGLGQTDDGVKDLMAGVEGSPMMDTLRLELIETLLKLGREPEAVDVAEAGIKPRPNDVRLVGSVADRFASTGRWNRAVRYYKMLWQQLADEPSAILYVNALLSSTPPGLSDAEGVLATASLNTDKSMNLLMIRASLRRKQGRDDAARGDAVAAFDRCAATTGGPALWMDRLRKTFGEPRTMLVVLRAVKPPPALADWVTAQQAIVMTNDAPQRSEGTTTLQGLLANSVDRTVRLDACGALTMVYSQDEKWNEAVEVSRKGMELSPQDPMFCNNAAYFLNEKLQKPKDALAYAERAVTLAPDNDRIMDTLAVVHWQLGNRDQAMQIEGDALRKSRVDTDKAEWALKLAGWKLAAKDKTGATGLLDTLREMLADTPELAPAFKARIDQLDKDIQAAP